MTMKSVFSSFYVDLMSTKSKTSILWVLIIVGMSVVNMKSVSFLYLVTRISLLFMNDEKGMYATNFAPVNKKSTVYGRYVFSFLSFVFCLVINLLADLIVPYFYAGYIVSSPYFYVVMFVVFALLIAIELPLLYWQGYTKMRIIQFAIFVGTMLIILKIVGEEKLYSLILSLNMNVQLVLPLLVITIVLLIRSVFMSVKIYDKKDI